MALPIINININNTLYGPPENGELIYKYSAFQNLKKLNTITGNTDLFPLRLSVQQAELNIDEPLELTTEVAYDGSVNLIVNDKKNPPKLINSRFYLTDSNSYNIADRKGNLDTNIYTEENFSTEASLIKAVKTIVSVDFLGTFSGGKLPVGNYTFYFKLADSDGNESDFIAESGKVVCFIGDINQPRSIRGGQLNENSNKLIKFRLNNLDLAYDYINVYYTRSSGDGDSAVVTTHKIIDKFKIDKLNTEISITGYEDHEELSLDDINVRYTSFNSVKSLTTCQNIAFSGNIINEYSLFETLEKYSLFITPKLVTEDDIGNLSSNYYELYPNTGYEYYNSSNIYYKLGLWDEEIYRYGIVYILNDFTLSPEFNIRGIKELNSDTTFNIPANAIDKDLNFQEDYIIEGTQDHNAKGVFKINNSDKNTFNQDSQIKPIGLKFNFEGNVVNGTALNKGLRELTKGFFIVRQERIPTVLAQSVGIGTASKSYTPVIKGTTSTLVRAWLGESFLKKDENNKPKLESDIFTINDVKNNALLCPEASLRAPIFNSIFNSSEYKLKPFKYQPKSKYFYDRNNTGIHFSLDGLSSEESYGTINTSLILIEPGIDLIKNDQFKFSSRAGNPEIVYKHSDPILGDYEDLSTNGNKLVNDTVDFNNSTSKLRGEFNTYIGCSTQDLTAGTYYNIYSKDYDFEGQWKNYFKLRYNDSSPFMPVGDRTSWDTLTFVNSSKYISKPMYRGDCYINTFTHRMNWNFIDPTNPTNKRILDPYTWYKNFRVLKKASTVITSADGSSTSLVYKKLLPLFTYRDVFIPSFSGETSENEPIVNGIIEPDSKKYKKYSEINGIFGAEEINRPDVNAVPLGHWVTFKICSNINLALRDLDYSNPEEESVHRIKRGFYPLQAMDKQNPLPESTVINAGISKTLGNKYYFEVPDVPFIKSNFGSRIYYSNPLQKSAFTNGNRVFLSKNYTDYTMEYGSLVKLIEWYGTLIAVMEHGVLMIPVKERAMMQNEAGENIYINTDVVLPENPRVLSNTFGSLWEDSVVKTSRFIYGIDTVAKKVWRTNGETFETISDMKIQKFLNDNIKLKETDTNKTVGANHVKTHYNAFKQDVLFVFKYGNEKWHLCWNELLGKWVTQYTWFPEFSENINNIFYTFGDKSVHERSKNYLYKHGFAGTEEVSGDIKSTFWYEDQHRFEFEFVVADTPGVQKIFNNLKIISNLVEPHSFYFEVVGEGFDWNTYKKHIASLKTETEYKTFLQSTTAQSLNIKKLPFIPRKSFDKDDLTAEYFYNLKHWSTPKMMGIRANNKTKEYLVNIFQKGLDIKDPKFGRLRGNMRYLEDSWDIQIQPISFKYIYMRGTTAAYTESKESKIRDKYIKIRVQYDGTDYAVINALRTLFTISYA